MSHLNRPLGRRDPIVHRVTAIWFPRFAIECWQRRTDRRGKTPPGDLPAALTRDSPHGPVVHAANGAAERAGVREGGRVADMRTLCPGLFVEQADIGGDGNALEQLMLWSRRWCPWTVVDGTAGIVMDTTGSDHLWGGEATMLRDIEERLTGLGFSCRLGTAPTHGAAWALSRLGATREICASENLAVPCLPLARRFGRGDPSGNPLLRLDQMMGRTPEPINAPGDPPRFVAEARLAEPVQGPLQYLPELAGQLCERLGEAVLGTRRIVLTIYRMDGETARVAAGAAHPIRDAEHIRRLFEGKLERIDPGFGFDLVTLSAPAVEPLSPIQTRLGGEAEEAVELARLTDRLIARFGAAAVKRASLRESHFPERRERWAAAIEPRRRLPGLAERLPSLGHIAASFIYRGEDRARINRLDRLAAAHGLGILATNDVLYHEPKRRPLQDVMTCIHERCTLATAGFRLETSAERHLKPPREMIRLFAEWPHAVRAARDVADACRFDLEELAYEYPREAVPEGMTPLDRLEQLTWRGAQWRYPNGVSPEIVALLEKELAMIEKLDIARYFLTVHDLVRFARHEATPPILCQGRGSAANSAVCHVLGITAVDPAGTICCSSVSSARSARNRPISMWISSTNGARR